MSVLLFSYPHLIALVMQPPSQNDSGYVNWRMPRGKCLALDRIYKDVARNEFRMCIVPLPRYNTICSQSLQRSIVITCNIEPKSLLKLDTWCLLLPTVSFFSESNGLVVEF